MELKINRETVPAAESIFDGVQEQGAELDYILPDYYPDIFRLVRCEAVPSVTDWEINGNRLTYSLRCDIRILYCGEDGAIQCVTQQQSFTKSAELCRECTMQQADVNISTRAGRVSFRAVNKRRLDIRAAISVKICVQCERTQEVVSDAFGMNIQLKKVPICFTSSRLHTDKMIQISGDAELSQAQPDVRAVLLSRCSPGDCELKLISGKLLAKGEAEIWLLYSADTESGDIEEMTFRVPYSQIIELDGVDDTYECSVSAETVSCEISPSADRSGQERLLKCDMELRLRCRAVKTASVMAAQDAFSTSYPCEVTVSEITAEQLPAVHTGSFRHSVKLCQGEELPEKVFSVWCSPGNVSARLSDDGSSAVISGMLTFSAAARDSSGSMTMPDRTETFENSIPVSGIPQGSPVAAKIAVSGVSYSISPEGVLTADADISARVTSGGSGKVRAVSDIDVDSSVKKQRDGDYAVKLYFGAEDESVWDIAKRFSTSAAAVAEENDITGDRLEKGGMILIPMTD
ncbi:MAG: DUF3794 domain-containing protein [Ruminococcus sp.]|nr:DUF3794 domain-containing protein [Ruminococcus sp.]